MSFLLQKLTGLVQQFSRKRPIADAGGIGLENAVDSGDGSGWQAGARTGTATATIGGCHKGIGAVVNIQKGALCAFEQDFFALFQGFV